MVVFVKYTKVQNLLLKIIQLGGNLDAANYNINSIGVATVKSYKDTNFTYFDGASVDIDPDNGGIASLDTREQTEQPTATNFDPC